MHRPVRGIHRAALVTVATLAGVGALLAAACGDGEAKWDARSLEATVTDLPFAPIIVNSNLGVGKNRLTIALFDENQELITDAEVTATFYHLDKEPEGEPKNPQRVGDALTLPPHTLKSVGVARLGNAMVSRLPRAAATAAGDAHIGHDSTVYASVVDFDRAGFWGVSLDVKAMGKTHSGARMVFVVQERTMEPRVGDPALPTKQVTLADVKSVEEIDSSPAPNPELHRMTIADAIASGKPTVIAFVTPAFCQTRFCGPVLDQVVTPAWTDFKGRVNFLHVEPYDIAKARGGTLVTVPAVQDWKLLAEPLIFVVGRDGIITAKFEGIMDYPELRAAIEETLKK